jgi:hypothetical protein
MFAWLDHVDVKQHNSLDMWVTDPEEATRHYVKHYYIDFGKSLGQKWMTSVRSSIATATVPCWRRW